MFLSIVTTHRPAADLGFLLHKHPERVYQAELGFGMVVVFNRRRQKRDARQRLCRMSVTLGWFAAKAEAKGC